MRVLYFTRDYTPHDYRFLTSLVENEIEVYSLRLERRGQQLEDRALPMAVRQVPWQGGQQPFRWQDLPVRLSALKRLLREIQPDVLHAGPIQTAAFLGALSGFHPLVTMSWGSDLLKDADRSRAYRWITRYTLSRSDVLVGDCQAVQEKAAAFGFPAERSFIFPWGIDLQRFSPAAGDGSDGVDGEPDSAQVFRSRLGWQGAFIALSLRSWEPVYGVDVMLRGFALAAREAPDLRLLMLGGGSQAGLVHQIIRENDLQDRVYLGGQINQADLPKMYRAADLYISASHSDGSSVSLMEALGCGLPVLVTDIPGNREWVVEGQQGWLFPDGDCSAVARGILRALHLAKNTPETFAEIRRASRLRAEQRADWKNNFQVLLQAYQHATGRCDKRHE